MLIRVKTFLGVSFTHQVVIHYYSYLGVKVLNQHSEQVAVCKISNTSAFATFIA